MQQRNPRRAGRLGTAPSPAAAGRGDPRRARPGRPQSPPTCLRVCFAPGARMLWLRLCIHTCAPLASLPGKGSSPQTVPPVTRGHGCRRQRRPRAGVARQGGERGERGGEPRPSPVGCLVLTLLSRLRHLVCCYATFPLPLPIPPFKSQALQGEDAVGKWDQLLPRVLGFVHSPSSTTCTLSAPFA